MTKKKGLRSVRQFSVEFKKAIVLEHEKGKYSVRQLCRLHDLHISSVYVWIHKYSTAHIPDKIVIEMKQSSTKKLKEMEKKLKEYEQIIGKKQMEIDYLNQVCQNASDHFGVDVKKNLDTNPSKD